MNDDIDLYSLSLGLALAVVVVSVLAALATLRSGRRPELAARERRWVRAGALAALVLVAFSGIFHTATGHRPGSPQAMTATDFLAEHPALALVTAAAALVLWTVRRGGPGRRG